MIKVINGWDIYLSVGDTGTIRFRPRKINTTLTKDDRVLFTMRDRIGNVLIEKLVVPGNNNVVTIGFTNPDTKNLDPNTYSYDVRYIIKPYYDADDKVVGGQQVITPKEAQKFVLVPVVGRV